MLMFSSLFERVFSGFSAGRRHVTGSLSSKENGLVGPSQLEHEPLSSLFSCTRENQWADITATEFAMPIHIEMLLPTWPDFSCRPVEKGKYIVTRKALLYEFMRYCGVFRDEKKYFDVIEELIWKSIKKLRVFTCSLWQCFAFLSLNVL